MSAVGQRREQLSFLAPAISQSTTYHSVTESLWDSRDTDSLVAAALASVVANPFTAAQAWWGPWGGGSPLGRRGVIVDCLSWEQLIE